MTIEGLKKDLTDLHCQVRVAAIATCASGAVNRPEVGPDSDQTGLGNNCDHHCLTLNHIMYIKLLYL